MMNPATLPVVSPLCVLSGSEIFDLAGKVRRVGNRWESEFKLSDLATIMSDRQKAEFFDRWATGERE